MKNSDYWKRRAIEVEAYTQKMSDDLISQIDIAYRKTASEIQKEIRSWYNRIADANGISYADAKKLLSKGELEEFKWSVEEYIKAGQNPKQWAKELENASAKAHITQLEAIKLQLKGKAEELYKGKEEVLSKTLKNVYSEGYYHGIFNIQQGFGVGGSFHVLSDETVNSVIKKPWTLDKTTFSDRIWDNKNKLVNNLHQRLTQGVVRGDSPDEMIDDLTKVLGSNRNNVARLVRTETAAAQTKAQAASFKQMGCKKFEIVATFDLHTSEICQDMDGKVFDMIDAQSGVTMPPFHPYCRSVIAPWFDDEFTENEVRAAKDEEGDPYEVPSTMTYNEWYKKHVSNAASSNTMNLADPYDAKMKDYRTFHANNVNRQSFAQDLLDNEGLALTAQVHPISNYGQCAIGVANGKVDVRTYELHFNDLRTKDYQTKTTFHELFHAKANDLPVDLDRSSSTFKVDFANWSKIEDTFAECASHYMTEQIGILHEIAPAYSRYLVEVLPKLKTTFPKFKNCSNIVDFGREVMSYRFGANSSAKWLKMYETLDKQAFDIVKYAKDNYVDYIKANADNLVDKFLETMPDLAIHKANMLIDLDDGIKLVEAGSYPTNNAKMVFENALINAMNRLGVK